MKLFDIDIYIIMVLIVSIIFTIFLCKKRNQNIESFESKFLNNDLNHKCGKICKHIENCKGYYVNDKNNECTIFNNAFDVNNIKSNYCVKNKVAKLGSLNKGDKKQNSIYTCKNQKHKFYDNLYYNNKDMTKAIPKKKIDKIIDLEPYRILKANWRHKSKNIDNITVNANDDMMNIINKVNEDDYDNYAKKNNDDESINNKNIKDKMFDKATGIINRLNNKNTKYNVFKINDKYYTGDNLGKCKNNDNISLNNCLKICINDKKCHGVEFKQLLEEKNNKGEIIATYKNVCCPKSKINMDGSTPHYENRSKNDNGMYYEKNEVDNFDVNKIYFEK